MQRHSIVVILFGIISTMAGLATIDHFRQRRCGEMAGRWVEASRQCAIPSGELVGTGTLAIFLGGALVAAAVGFTCYRASLYASGRAKRIFAEK